MALSNFLGRMRNFDPCAAGLSVQYELDCRKNIFSGRGLQQIRRYQRVWIVDGLWNRECDRIKHKILCSAWIGYHVEPVLKSFYHESGSRIFCWDWITITWI